MVNVYLNVLITRHLLFQILICHRIFQNKVFLKTFCCPLIGVKTIDNPDRDDQKKAMAAE